MAKRIFAAILASLLLASTLAACSGDTPEDTTAATGNDTTASTTTVEETTTQDPRLVDDLPTDVKFDGQNFTVMERDYDAGSVAWLVVSVYTEEENGERINDAVYARNREMNERFGVTVKARMEKDPNGVMRSMISAGEDSVDIMQNLVSQQSAMAVEGYVLELNALDYIDLSKAWWDTVALERLAIGGRNYTAFGSAQLNAYKGTWATIFNKELVKDAGLPDLYQVVRDGDWTLDNLLKYGQAIKKDVNGDGKMEWGVDVYGIGLETGAVIPLFMGTGERITTFDDDGSFTINLDSPRLVDAAEKIWNFVNADKTTIVNPQKQNLKSTWVEYRATFASGNIGIILTHLGTPTLIAGIMEADFGILPFPKALEDQEEYYSDFQYGSGHGLIIPKTVGNQDKTAMLTEAYEMMAHDTVREAYYDYTLTLRAARDNESSEMLDIIFGNRNMDPIRAYHTTTGFDSMIQTILNDESAFTYSSSIAEKKASVEAGMKKVVDAVMKVEQ